MCILRYKSSSVLVIQTMFWLLKWCSRWHQPFLAMKVLIDKTNGKHTLTTGIWSQAPPGQTHFVWAVELEFGRRATSVLHTISIWNIPSSWHLSKVCLPSRLVTGDQATHQCWEQPYLFPGKQAYIDLGAKVHESIVLDWGLLVSGHYWLKEDCRNMFDV